MTANSATLEPTMPSLRVAWGGPLRIALIGFVVSIYLCVVGIVGTFATRPIVAGVVSLGQTSLLLAFIAAGYLAARRAPSGVGGALIAGALAGFVTGLGPSALVLVGSVVPLRAVAVQLSPALFSLLTLGNGVGGAWILPVGGAVLGAVSGVLTAVPRQYLRPIAWALVVSVVIGLFSPLIRVVTQNLPPITGIGRLLFATEGLTVTGAIVTVVLAVLLQQANRVVRFRRSYQQTRTRLQATLPPPAYLALTAAVGVIGLLVIGWLPVGLGSFFAQVVALVAIYILMGFGLNITLGLAGLLDLGFVAFFAVGAYTVGLLTSTGEFGIAHWPFWLAVVPAVLFAMSFGIFFGLPILGIRGDYLAIATLGFGEIVRILAGSDLLGHWLGGPNGILDINKPIPATPSDFWAGPVQIYYIALIAAALVAFIAIRLRDSRLGRAWVAIREDEDVAEALGINLVQTKLLAYMMGAAFAGLGGAIFAGLIGSIFASSMQLFVSINVAALIIVGGMGSIPGVVVGAIFLIGLPELFREFSEFRYLFYGFALIAMMLYRPEGLLPTKIAQRELHVETTDVTSAAAVPIGETPAS
jgi:branched-chain amino acid transport system permease protein